jgi:hypothetical protein
MMEIRWKYPEPTRGRQARGNKWDFYFIHIET